MQRTLPILLNTEEQNVTIDTSEASTETIELKAPPNAITPQDASSSMTMMLPLTGSMGVMVFMAISNNNNTRMLFMSGGMVVAMLSMVVLNVYRHIRQHRNNVTNQRREYLGYISEVRSEVREAAKNQRHTAVSHLPEPEALPYLVQHGPGCGNGDKGRTTCSFGWGAPPSRWRQPSRPRRSAPSTPRTRCAYQQCTVSSPPTPRWTRFPSVSS